MAPKHALRKVTESVRVSGTSAKSSGQCSTNPLRGGGRGGSEDNKCKTSDNDDENTRRHDVMTPKLPKPSTVTPPLPSSRQASRTQNTHAPYVHNDKTFHSRNARRDFKARGGVDLQKAGSQAAATASSVSCARRLRTRRAMALSS